MVKLLKFLVLASGLVATAFSLDKTRISGPVGAKIGSVRAASKPELQHSTPTFLAAAGNSKADVVAEAIEEKSGPLSFIWNEKTKLSFYLAIWYGGNVYYNIYNKKACIALGKNAAGGSNLHWALSAAQLLVGALLVTPMWLTGLRRAPELSADNWKELAPVGLWAALSHAFSVLSMAAGAVSFGQIVKSAEPVFAAFTNALLLKDIDHPMVYAALLPIIGGVGLASLKELSFTWTALIAASLANQAAAFKNVVSKGVMKKPWAKAMGPQNTYAVVTLLALLCTLPLVAVFDAKDFAAVYKQVQAMGTGKDVLTYSVLSGLAFYMYNEASFLALERLSPVTHSVANTLKRVIIIVASCIVFKTPVSTIGAVGSGVAVLGTLMYSLAKGHYSKGKGGGH